MGHDPDAPACSGLSRRIRPEQEDQACAIALEQPRQIRTGLARIVAQFGIRPSLEWLRRLLRRHRMRYKRIRASLRSKREQAAFHSRSHEIDAAAQELVALQQEEAAGRIKLYYGDAAGFALRPALSYAWQRIGARIEYSKSGIKHQVYRAEGIRKCIICVLSDPRCSFRNTRRLPTRQPSSQHHPDPRPVVASGSTAGIRPRTALQRYTALAVRMSAGVRMRSAALGSVASRWAR